MNQKEIKVVVSNAPTMEEAIDTMKTELVGKELPYKEKNLKITEVKKVGESDDNIIVIAEGENMEEVVTEDTYLDVVYSKDEKSYDINFK